MSDSALRGRLLNKLPTPTGVPWSERVVPAGLRGRPAAGGGPKPPPAAVLLASPGLPFTAEAVRAAVDRAEGGSIRVLSVAKIYGTSLGMQHPGLLPSKREIKAQEDIVADAIQMIQKSGGKARGEIVATRNPAKTFAKAALVYSVHDAVLVPAKGGRLRRLVEGDPASTLRRRLGAAVRVQVVEGTAS